MTVLSRTHFDPSERTFYRERVQDVAPIVEHNKQLQTIEQKSDWGRHTAKVPLVIIEHWLNEEYERGNIELRYLGPGFEQWLKRKLDDPDNRAWRVDNPSNPFFTGWKK